MDAVLPISHGGINMPDIVQFWNSLKCSWTRRFFNTKTAWHKILQVNLLYHGFEMDDLLYGGPNLLKRIAARLTNQFWKNTLMAFGDLQSETPFHRPDYFFNLNFFENSIFKYGDNCIKKADFGLLWDKGIRQVGDLCNCSLEPPQLYSREDLNRNFNVEIDFLRYKQLKTGIEHGAKRVNNKIDDRHLSDPKIAINANM